MKVRWKIGQKPAGNWYTPLHFEAVIDGEELQLNPELVFCKKYEFPNKILLAKTTSLANGAPYCSYSYVFELKADDYIKDKTVLKLQKPVPVCQNCTADCYMFLPYREGDQDYSDYEKVFRQIAKDIISAWQDAVNKARNVKGYNIKEVIITTCNLEMEDTPVNDCINSKKE